MAVLVDRKRYARHRARARRTRNPGSERRAREGLVPMLLGKRGRRLRFVEARERHATSAGIRREGRLGRTADS